MHNLKVIEFQGKPIYYAEFDEQEKLVLIKPFCEALGVDADNQIRRLKLNIFLRDAVRTHKVLVPGDGQSRDWTCLPDELIYAWVFGIKLTNTMKPETKELLTTYKRQGEAQRIGIAFFEAYLKS